MHRIHLFVAATLAMMTAGQVAAQEFKFPPPADLFGQGKPAPKSPAIDWKAGPAAETAAKPSVVCGMTLIPADPKLDPKMRIAPQDNGVKYAMRVDPPPVCAPQR